MGLMVDVAARTQGDRHVSSVVRLVGQLEPATIPSADKVVKPLLANGPSVLVFDLAGVDFITSTGIGFLLAAKSAMEKRGGACYFSSPTPQVRKVFEIMRALPAKSVFGSVKELDEYLGEIQRKVTDGDE